MAQYTYFRINRVVVAGSRVRMNYLGPEVARSGAVAAHGGPSASLTRSEHNTTITSALCIGQARHLLRMMSPLGMADSYFSVLILSWCHCIRMLLGFSSKYGVHDFPHRASPPSPKLTFIHGGRFECYPERDPKKGDESAVPVQRCI